MAWVALRTIKCEIFVVLVLLKMMLMICQQMITPASYRMIHDNDNDNDNDDDNDDHDEGGEEDDYDMTS
jgi:hypothetical protein